MRRRQLDGSNVFVDSAAISKLQNQVSSKLAKIANRENSSKKNDLVYNFDKEIYLKLSEYNRILERVLFCDSCIGCFKVDQIINIIKNNLNRV